MDDNLYKTPDAAYTDDNIKGRTKGPRGDFDFNRAWNLAVKGYKRNMGPSMLFLLIVWALSIMAVFTCFGLFFAVPHLTAATYMLGLAMIRRDRIEPEVMFCGFQSYGRILGLYAIIFTFGLFINLLSSLPPLIHFSLTKTVTLNSAEDIANWFLAYSKFTDTSIGLLYNLLSIPLFIVNMYVAVRWLVCVPLILERNYSPLEALSESWHLTEEKSWSIFGLYFVGSIAGSLGILFCFVGIILSIPFFYAIIGAIIYQLLGEDTVGKDSGAGKDREDSEKKRAIEGLSGLQGAGPEF